eukprot:scaffold183868_cov35-Tisochrysis_lutea.AAC.1
MAYSPNTFCFRKKGVACGLLSDHSHSEGTKKARDQLGEREASKNSTPPPHWLHCVLPMGTRGDCSGCWDEPWLERYGAITRSPIPSARRSSTKKSHSASGVYADSSSALRSLK